MKLVFLGPPGAGKGTLSTLAKDALKIPHISTGDLFRAAIKAETPLGLQIKKIVDSGGLVPDEITIEVVRQKLSGPAAPEGFILDGFPRTVPQAEALQSIAKPDMVINFVLAHDEIIKRLSGRRVCKSCGTNFHVESLPPKKAGVCDACGAELITRKDDEALAIAKRLSAYETSTAPLVDYYQKKGLLKNIDAAPQPAEVLKTLAKILR